METLTILAFKVIIVIILLVNILPVINSHNQAEINDACNNTITQVTDITGKFIEHVAETAPVNTVIDQLK